MKKLLTFAALTISAVSFSLCASAEDTEGYIYAVKADGTAIITGYDSAIYGSLHGDIAIPEVIDGYTVTEIAPSAFDYESGIYSVDIPGTITAIGSYAFDSCFGMETVTLHEGLITIEENAFQDCIYLGKIEIPHTVEYIGERAFYCCSGLERVIIGDGVRVISEAAFENCYNLSEVILGENVREIKEYAFSDCRLGTVYIPVSVRVIEDYAFGVNYDIEVNYAGTREEWDSIDIGGGNSELNYGEVMYNRDNDGNINKEANMATVSVITIYAVLAAILIGIVVFIAARKNDKCRHCGAVLEEDSVFCGNCGTKLK